MTRREQPAKQTVLIVGAGIGGLATANLLAKAGYTVHVYEKETRAGGRAGLMVKKGFRFDTGPSWYLMPEVFAHYYELLGEDINNHLNLVRLKPAYKVFFDEQSPLTVIGDLEQDASTFASIEKGSDDALRRYVAFSSQIYKLSLGQFLYTNFSHPGDLLNKTVLKNGGKMLQLGAQSVHRYVSSFVRDQRLQQILEYPMVFLGSSPFQAPAIYSLMSALDFEGGVYYPMGGMYSIIESLVTIGKKLGVHYHYRSEVGQITIANKKVSGIRLATGKVIDGDIVISNSDLHFTETRLLHAQHQSYPKSYWQTKDPGPSALLLYLGIRGKLPTLDHHNLLFVKHWQENFDAIYKTKTFPERASIYISKTSQTDPTVAPNGHENIFVLVPIPAGITLSATRQDKLIAQYLAQIKDMTGVDLTQNVVTKEVFGPNEFRTKYYSWQSSMLGQSHVLSQSAMFRTPNKSKKVENLFYVGGNTVPGIGLPMCLISAELVFKRLVGDKKGGPISPEAVR